MAAAPLRRTTGLARAILAGGDALTVSCMRGGTIRANGVGLGIGIASTSPLRRRYGGEWHRHHSRQRIRQPGQDRHRHRQRRHDCNAGTNGSAHQRHRDASVTTWHRHDSGDGLGRRCNQADVSERHQLRRPMAAAPSWATRLASANAVNVNGNAGQVLAFAIGGVAINTTGHRDGAQSGRAGTITGDAWAFALPRST